MRMLKVEKPKEKKKDEGYLPTTGSVVQVLHIPSIYQLVFMFHMSTCQHDVNTSDEHHRASVLCRYVVKGEAEQCSFKS